MTIVHFQFDSARFADGASRRALADLAKAIKNTGRAVRITAFADSTGSETYNQGLSERRAAKVVRVLRELGVQTELIATGRGEDDPVATNTTTAGRALNRRAECMLTAVP